MPLDGSSGCGLSKVDRSDSAACVGSRRTFSVNRGLDGERIESVYRFSMMALAKPLVESFWMPDAPSNFINLSRS